MGEQVSMVKAKGQDGNVAEKNIPGFPFHSRPLSPNLGFCAFSTSMAWIKELQVLDSLSGEFFSSQHLRSR